jgi:hypothetical protein
MQNYDNSLNVLTIYSDSNGGYSESSQQSFIDQLLQVSKWGPKSLPLGDNDYHLWKYSRQNQVGTLQSINGSNGYWEERRGVFANTNSGHVGTFRSEGLTSSDQYVSDLLDAKLLEKWRGNIDLSVDLIQGRQTANLVKKLYDVQKYVRSFNVNGLWKSYKDFRRLGADALERLKGLSTREKLAGAGGLWLEYSYGIKPLVQTAYDVAIELGRNIESHRNVEARVSHRFDKSDVRDGSFGGLPAFFGKESTEVHDSIRGHIKVRVAASADFIQLASKFSSLNPASILWENLPFSFCVDWVYDVGGYLRNMETSLISQRLAVSGYKTISTRLKSDTVITVSKVEAPSGGHFGVVKGWDRLTQVRRVRITSFPMPSTPRFSVDFSSPYRAANAIALNLSFLKDKK